MDVVEKLVQQIDDPRAKQIGERALNILRPGVRDFIEAARESVRNPEDRNLVDKTADIMEVPPCSHHVPVTALQFFSSFFLFRPFNLHS